MIRKATPKDFGKLTQLWLESSLKAHDFVAENYWQKMAKTVTQYYLPNIETYVYEDRHCLKGFISLGEQNYIGALFVDKDHQCQKIGRKLLGYVRRHRAHLSLKVFVQNRRAISFYQRSGFKIVSEQKDVSTGEIELIMSWALGCRSGFQKRVQGDS